MIPQSYATDTQAKATELASTVAAALSPQQIASACTAVDSFLRKHTPDQQRWFFSITFPALICRVFGFDDASPPSATTKRHPSNGWIDVATSGNDSELSGRILSLLSPNGLLLSSILGVDRLSLVKYVFPNERLPEWVRYMLRNEEDCRVLTDLCPLFRNRVKEDPIKGSACQVQLNVLEYYLFWFAYYPVCRGNSEGSETVKIQRTKKFTLENWSYSIPGLSSNKREAEKKTECNLYLRLLYVYLHSFVPSQDLYMQPYRSSLLHYSPGYDSSVIERAEFVVNTMIHFWLVDSDFSPLATGMCKENGVIFPFRSVLGETPPTPGLGDVINVFIKYLNMSSLVDMNGPDKTEVRSPGWGGRVSGSYDVVNTRDAAPSINSIGSWNSMIQRPLYRFILRTFLFCPVESSIKNASQAFSLWISYLEPWSIGFEEFADLIETLGLPNVSSNSVNKSSTSGYSSSWQGFVLDNYLFYSSLVMHFIGFAHKFLHTDAEIILQMVAKLQDWEDGLCESDADGSFLLENWNKDLRLFADGEDGGQQLLQLFLLRAESELQSVSGSNLSQNLQCLGSLKAQLSQLFGSSISKSPAGTPQSRHHQQSREEIFKPRSFGNQTGAEIKYRGDWMKRPVSSDEIAWLASVLVSLSGWLNEKVGLNRIDPNQGTSSWSYLEVLSDVKSVQGTKETLKVILCSFISWVLWLGEAGVQLMRRHGLRINLRMLASKKIIAMVLVFIMFNVLKRAFAL